MSCIIFPDDEESQKRINIDELYEKNKQRDLRQLSIFNKILNRIHKRITFTGRNKRNDKHIWFTVPEYIFGEPLFDHANCVAYIISKLEENGFYIQYIHPNCLFISWLNWVPSYVRNELKKKRGLIVDEKGNIIEKVDNGGEEKKDENADTRLMNYKNGVLQPPKKQFNSTDQYKPTGKLVYNSEMFDKLEQRFVNK
jgi:hypothetical protein